MTDVVKGTILVRPRLLEDLLAPKTIAIVGASADPGKLGGRVMQHLRRFQPPVRLVGVSRSGGDGTGEWVASLKELDGPVDQVLVAVPAAAAAGVIREAAEAGAKSAIVFAAGFGETGTADGAQLRQELVGSAPGSGMRVLGPNCLGYMAVRDTGDLVMAAGFGTLDGEDAGSLPITPAPVALISQSGGVGSMIVGHLRSLHVWPKEYVSTGNEYDVTLTELVTAYASDPYVRVIGLYLEGIQDPAELAHALATARAGGKLVACMIGGRTAAGGRAVTSHSGRLARDGDLAQEFVERCGAVVANGPWEMALLLERAVRLPRQAGSRAGVIAASGGMSAVSADLLAGMDFDLPELSAATVAGVTSLIPAFAQAGNPLDIGGATMQDPQRMPAISKLMLSDPGLDVVVVTAGSMNEGALNIAHSVISASADSDKPCLVYWPHVRAEAERALWEAGVPCLTKESDLRLALDLARREWPLAPADTAPAGDPIASPAAVAFRSVATAGKPVSVAGTRRMMQILGFEIPRGTIVTDETQLAQAINDIDVPLVVKGASPDIIHKAERGLVAVNLRNASQVTEAFRKIQSVLRELGLGPEVLVEKHWTARYEVMIGFSRTRLGTVLMFGTGGTGVEQVGDVQREFLPLRADSIDRLLAQTVIGRTLAAQLPRVGDRLQNQLRRVAKLAEDTAEFGYDLDINPLAITSLGRLVVLDASFSPTAPAGGQ